MSNDETAVPRLVAIDRRQMLLRTVDVEKLVEQEHSVRSIWELVGRLDLRLYYAQIAAVEGSAGREHTDPQLLISLWLYAYSPGISSVRRCVLALPSRPAVNTYSTEEAAKQDIERCKKVDAMWEAAKLLVDNAVKTHMETFGIDRATASYWINSALH
jgi:hypothetical protein